jgi:hypothetical protein
MLRPDEIERALHASRVVDMNTAAFHGPLGLEHLASLVEDLQARPPSMTNGAREALTIELRSETRKKLEQLANAQRNAPAGKFSAAELAAAIVERFVTSAVS